MSPASHAPSSKQLPVTGERGYNTWRMSDLTLIGPVEKSFTAEVAATNTGIPDGRHVVEVYAASTPDGGRELVGVTSVHVEAGVAVPVTISCSLIRTRDGDIRWSPHRPCPGRSRLTLGRPCTVTATLVLPKQ